MGKDVWDRMKGKHLPKTLTPHERDTMTKKKTQTKAKNKQTKRNKSKRSISARRVVSVRVIINRDLGVATMYHRVCPRCG